MIIEYHQPSEIKTVLKAYLSKQGKKPLFVFPSNVAADSWCDWAVLHPEESGTEAVELENFTAWDKFKGEFLSTKISNKVSIPSLLRKLFIRNLIHKNNTEQQILKKIIPASTTDDATTYTFTDWLSRILTSLKLWHDAYEALPPSQRREDDEDRDYQTIYREYSTFLEKHHFFEPAWERPEFTDSDRAVLLIYPELLEDFADYEEIFAKAENITAIKLPKEFSAPVKAYSFSDSRKELRRILLHLRELHDEKHVPWTDMALNVPDIETYSPYIKREFGRYCVPCQLRSGKPLTCNSAGSIFKQFSEAYNGQFSYTTIRALVQNEYIPWKETFKEVRENLVREGNELRCLCAYKENGVQKDSWIESLSKKQEAPAQTKGPLWFYKRLTDSIKAICTAARFEDIHKAWIDFKNYFLATDDFSDEANRILGRCISELNDLRDIENNYIIPLGLSTGPCYDFFLSELNGKIYRPQESIDGVSIFPYKLAAAANFPYHFTIDASQKNLDIQYKKLSFLNTEKRERLLKDKTDTNVSEAFIRLYAKNASAEEVLFSYSEDSFQGFAIAHTALSVIKEDGYSALDGKDFIRAEEETRIGLPAFSPRMQRSFKAWQARMKGFGTTEAYHASSPLQEKVRQHLIAKRQLADYALPAVSGDCIKLSQTDMRNFFPCPRRWIFSQVLRLREDSLDTRLMQRYDMGNIHHRMLELFMKDYADSGKALPVTQKNGRFSNEEEADCRERLTGYAKRAIAIHYLQCSALVQTTLSSQIPLLVDNIMRFLYRLCIKPEKPVEVNSKTGIKGFGSFFVKGAEIKYSAPASDAQENSLYYFGKIDCLLYEKNSSGRNQYALIDYKNSSSSLPDGSEALPSPDGILGDFQMPLYVRLVEENDIKGDEREHIEAAYFYSIKDDKLLAVIDDYKGKAKTVAGPERPKSYEVFQKDTLPLFKEYTDTFSRCIQNNHYEATSITGSRAKSSKLNTKSYKDCINCQFKCICRSTFTIAPNELPQGVKTTEEN